MGDEWTDSELEHAVLAYRSMLRQELSGSEYSKTAVRAEALAGPLHGRTAGSFEYRMQNISAVLGEMGLPRLNGYKPASNVGARVWGRVEELVIHHWSGTGPHRRWTVRAASPLDAARVERIEIGDPSRESFPVAGVAPATARATERSLVARYKEHLEVAGSAVCAHRYIIGDSTLICDLFNESRAQLIEAKAAATRENARMAVGQLLDYQRFEAGASHMGALFPNRPHASVLAYLADLNVVAIWEDHTDGFRDTACGDFV